MSGRTNRRRRQAHLAPPATHQDTNSTPESRRFGSTPAPTRRWLRQNVRRSSDIFRGGCHRRLEVWPPRGRPCPHGAVDPARLDWVGGVGVHGALRPDSPGAAPDAGPYLSANQGAAAHRLEEALGGRYSAADRVRGYRPFSLLGAWGRRSVNAPGRVRFPARGSSVRWNPCSSMRLWRRANAFRNAQRYATTRAF